MAPRGIQSAVAVRGRILPAQSKWAANVALFINAARAVRDAISKFRDLAHTSVLTVMNIMVDKGYLKRRKEGGHFVYTPRMTREKTARNMLGDIVDRVFEGSATAAMVNLLESENLAPEELRDIQKLIENKRKGRRDEPG